MSNTVLVNAVASSTPVGEQAIQFSQKPPLSTMGQQVPKTDPIKKRHVIEVLQAQDQLDELMGEVSASPNTAVMMQQYKAKIRPTEKVGAFPI